MAQQPRRGTARRWLALAAAVAFCVPLAQRQAVGGAGEAAPKVSNVFIDTDLRQALQDISAATGVTIIPDPTVHGLITADLHEVPLESALEIVLTGTGYMHEKVGNLYLVYSCDPSGPTFRTVSQTRYVRMQYADAKAAQRMLPQMFRRYTELCDDTNTIAVRAPQKILDEIVENLNRFDRPGGHVLLDARIVVLEHSELLNIGVDWSFPTVAAGAFSSSDTHGRSGGSVTWPWAVQIGYTTGKQFTNSLLLRLDMLQQNDEASIVAAPQVLAQDGRPAETRVAREEYFKIVSGGVYERVDLRQIDTGTVLTIVPRMSENGDITMHVVAEVSDVVSRGRDDLPVVTRRQAKSTVRFEDGGTVAIAGLMDSRSRQQDRLVPGFGRIPLLGRLFRHESDGLQTRQVAVFVTARILPDKLRELDETVERPRPVIPAVSEELFKLQMARSLRDWRRDLIQR